MLGSAAGFQADKMMRRSSGLFFILWITSRSCTTAGGQSVFNRTAPGSQTHDLDAEQAKACAKSSQAAHLIHALAAVVCMHVCVGCTEMPPLKAVHRPKVSLLPARRWLLHFGKLMLNPAQHDFLCMLAGIGPA